MLTESAMLTRLNDEANECRTTFSIDGSETSSDISPECSFSSQLSFTKLK